MKQIFLKRLTASIQVILVFTKESASVESLAEIADKIAEAYNQFAMMVPISSTNSFVACTDSSELTRLPHATLLRLAERCTDFFSKIDLVRAYNQISVEFADAPKAVIATPFGLFEFLKTPFGFRNAAQTF